MGEREAAVRDMEEQVRHYEDVMASNGLPTLRGRGSADAFHAAAGPKPRGRQMTIMQVRVTSV